MLIAHTGIIMAYTGTGIKPAIIAALKDKISFPFYYSRFPSLTIDTGTWMLNYCKRPSFFASSPLNFLSWG